METGTLKELNVNPGDVVECVEGHLHATKGKRYTVNEFCDIRHYGTGNTNSSKFRIISRAQDTPKIWGEMTDAEKGALLLAQHEGKVIEFLYRDAEWRRRTRSSEANGIFYDGNAYRVKPEPNRETVDIIYRSTKIEPHRITFDLIDGEPDCDSIRMERI